MDRNQETRKGRAALLSVRRDAKWRRESAAECSAQIRIDGREIVSQQGGKAAKSGLSQVGRC